MLYRWTTPPTVWDYATNSVGMRRGTDRQTHRHTDIRNQYTFRLRYTLREMKLLAISSTFVTI